MDNTLSNTTNSLNSSQPSSLNVDPPVNVSMPTDPAVPQYPYNSSAVPVPVPDPAPGPVPGPATISVPVSDQVTRPNLPEDPVDQPYVNPTPKVIEANTMAVKTSDALNENFSSIQEKPLRSNSNGDEVIAEIDDLENQVRSVNLPEELAEKSLRAIERLRRMARRGSYTGEFETVEKYIYWVTAIPWGKYSQDNLEISNAKRLMDQSHYGMEAVKNLVLDYLAVMQLQQGNTPHQGITSHSDMAVLKGSSANAPVMIFVGLQGVGKTSIAKSIANATNRKFIRIALGALGSVQALRGQSKAFLDAEPGQIVKALVRTGTMNPVILLDEIDKVSGQTGLLNDVMAALLEILDPEQNSTFVDHYIDFPVDLSKVFFICTANNLGSLSAALLDRMEVIRFTSYTDEEKIIIAKNYSMPKVLKNAGLTPDKVMLQDDIWPLLVRPVGFDAGLRQLERNLATIVRAAARRLVEGAPSPVLVTTENLTEFVLPDQGPLS